MVRTALKFVLECMLIAALASLGVAPAAAKPDERFYEADPVADECEPAAQPATRAESEPIESNCSIVAMVRKCLGENGQPAAGDPAVKREGVDCVSAGCDEADEDQAPAGCGMVLSNPFGNGCLIVTASGAVFDSEASEARKQQEPASGCADLTGTWLGENYYCEGSYRQEMVEIEYADGRIVATKLSGDRCVLEGSVTFFKENTKPVRCVVGTPDNPGSETRSGDILIRSQDSFTACSVNFSRLN